MKITKFEHACLVIEDEEQKLIIDPGIFSPSCTDFDNVSAVVVTHVHSDHFDPEKLHGIFQQNPNAKLYTVQTVSDELNGSLPLTVVSNGQKITSGPFELDFFGIHHALIHTSIATTSNIGVMVNNTLYYPGDALTVPHQPVKILAVPASGPWLKLGEAMDFITAIKPKQIFPTHNAILSDIGTGIHDNYLQSAAEAVGASYLAVKTGEVFHY